MLLIGEKIKQIKEINGFNQIGKVFEVTNIDDGVITFKCDFGIGVMNYKEFEKYFEKYVDYAWTEWINVVDDWINCVDYSYKTNNKKVIVEQNGFVGKASCAPCDTFDLQKGIELALKRIEVKKVKAELKDLIERM